MLYDLLLVLEGHASLGPVATLSQSVTQSVTHSLDKSYDFCELEDLYESRGYSDGVQSHVKSCKVKVYPGLATQLGL